MKYEEVKVNSERWFDLTPLLNEEFRDIDFLLGEYKVSNYGRIKSLKKSKIMKCYEMKIDKYQQGRESTTGNYYLIVHIGSAKYKIDKHFSIHRLVAQAFLNNYSDDLQVNHIDGKKNNNRIDNIEMATPSDNMKHSYKSLNRNKRKKAILMLDRRKNIIEEFECMSDVQRKYGYLVGTICNAIKNNYFSYGHYWKYKEEK